MKCLVLVSPVFQCWVFLTLACFLQTTFAGDFKVQCSPKLMTVSVNLSHSKSLVYLEGLKGYPGCKPRIKDDRAIFELSLEDLMSCATTRIYNRLTGRRLFYHRVTVEHKNKKETFLVKCDFPGTKDINGTSVRTRRNVLPEGFQEDQNPQQMDPIVKTIAAPYLHVGVRQNGRNIDTEVSVQPGTPLIMEVYLDPNSTEWYGIFVNSINVSDATPTRQEEVIILNGCSVDPYLFNNFETTDGDYLSSKFRAFKFPETTYVFFKGTVIICVNRCQGAACSNGQLGFGRRKRELPMSQADPNKVFEVTMTTIVKVEYTGKPETTKKDIQPFESGPREHELPTSVRLQSEVIKKVITARVEERQVDSSGTGSVASILLSLLSLLVTTKYL